MNFKLRTVACVRNVLSGFAGIPILFVVAGLGLPGCGESEKTGAPTGQVEEIDEAKLKAEAKAEAEKEITEENAEDVLEQLEGEIGADTGDE